jgi:hypothetical protein
LESRSRALNEKLKRNAHFAFGFNSLAGNYVAGTARWSPLALPLNNK